MRLATHVITLHFLVHLLAAFSQPCINGTVTLQGNEADVSQLHVTVYNSRGEPIETVPISSSLTFTCFQLPLSTGAHALYLYGASSHEYDHIIAFIQDQQVVLAYPRPNSLERLVTDLHEETSPNEARIHFLPRGPASFRPSPRQWSWRNWRKYRSRVLLIVAFVFLVWFPTIFRRLPKDLREELTGEKEPDLGDPNRVIKALLGDPAPLATQSKSTST